jgi:NAD-dependent SIR2 family protein deacetylase
MERRLERMAQAYCVKCKKKVEIQTPKQIIMKNKRPATKGVCPKCRTTVFRIGKA